MCHVLSINIMFLRFIHIVKCIVVCTCLLLNSIPLYDYSIVGFFHSPIDEYLGFQFGDITNNAVLHVMYKFLHRCVYTQEWNCWVMY